jgi:hypothetical protein
MTVVIVTCYSSDDRASVMPLATPLTLIAPTSTCNTVEALTFVGNDYYVNHETTEN